MPYNEKWFEDINKQLFELRLKIDSNNKDINRRDAYITSLDTFIKKNPKIKGISTKDFRDFFIKLVNLESSYRPHIQNKGSSYSGYYQLNIPSNTSIEGQHKKAFEHLANLFSEAITDYDINKARKMGISDAALLAKYWNQQNRITDYLHNGINSSDDLGSTAASYGNNIDIEIDLTPYVSKAITSNYHVLKKGELPANVIKVARNKDIVYSNRNSSILSYQDDSVKRGNKKVKFDITKMWPNDTLWLVEPSNRYK